MTTKIPVETVLTARDGLTHKLRQVGHAAGGISDQFGLLKAAAVGAFAAMSFGAAKRGIIDPAAQMQTALKNLGKVADDLTDADLSKLGRDASAIAIDMGRTATGVVNIMAQAKQSNFEGSLERMARQAAMTATAWDVTDEQAASFLTAFQKSMALSEDQTYALGDAVNQLSNTFNAEAGPLAEFVGRTGALGKAAGLSGVEVAALGAAIMNNKVPQERAATAAKNLMNALTKGEGATLAQRKAFKALGIDATELAKRMQKDASGAILDTLEALSGLEDYRQNLMLGNLVGEEGKAAIAPLLANLDELRRALGTVRNESGFLGAVRDEFLKFSDGNILVLEDRNAAAWRAFATMMGEQLLPTYEAVLEKSIVLAQTLTDLGREFPALAEAAGIAAAAIGIGGPLLIAVRLATKALGVGTGLGFVIKGVGLALTGLSRLIALSPLGTLVTAALAVVTHWEDVKWVIQTTRDTVRDALDGIEHMIGERNFEVASKAMWRTIFGPLAAQAELAYTHFDKVLAKIQEVVSAQAVLEGKPVTAVAVSTLPPDQAAQFREDFAAYEAREAARRAANDADFRATSERVRNLPLEFESLPNGGAGGAAGAQGPSGTLDVTVTIERGDVVDVQTRASPGAPVGSVTTGVVSVLDGVGPQPLEIGR